MKKENVSLLIKSLELDVEMCKKKRELSVYDSVLKKEDDAKCKAAYMYYDGCVDAFESVLKTIEEITIKEKEN